MFKKFFMTHLSYVQKVLFVYDMKIYYTTIFYFVKS